VTGAFVQVALPLPLKQTFTYAVPIDLRDEITVGSALLVPFRGRELTGFVVEVTDEPVEGAPERLREVLGTVEKGSLFPPDLLAVSNWMAEYYQCGLGEVLAAAVPEKGSRRRKRDLDVESVPTPEELVSLEEHPEFSLTGRQEEILVPLLAGLEGRQYLTAVLHGVTASGKTAVYERLVASALEEGRSAIILVPEISITPQIVALFRSRFGERVALFHSRLKSRDRYVQWRRVLDGEARVVIGPRSAVLAPVRDLGVIVVDEEHETSYKQTEPDPRYHARDVAVMRAREADALCVLGSATPSAESYRNALEGKYLLLEMPERISSRPMPTIELVDLAAEQKERRREGTVILGERLEQELDECLSRGEQSIIFLNRRGFSPAITCRDCGEADECRNCSVAMTYHSREGELVCHYCGVRKQPPTHCPACGSADLSHRGLGTQRVETALQKRYPEACVLRMDSDTTRQRGSHGALYRRFASGEGDILLGTQMVAKGFHFPGVTLVGVISADAELHFPDFRANERTFQLITQVAGRAGRGEEPGKVIVQSYASGNPGIDHAVSGDYRAFMTAELASRESLGYPPCGRMIRIVIRGREEVTVQKRGREVLRLLTKVVPDSVMVLGPAPAPLYRLNRWYRVHLFLRGPSALTLRRCVESSGIVVSGGGPVHLTVDVDPVDML